MKILADNNGYKLVYTPAMVNRFHVYKNCKVSPSDELSYELEVARGKIITTKIAAYFTKFQIDSAKAKIHGMKYATRFEPCNM